MFTFRPLRGIGDRGGDAWLVRLPAHPVFHYGLSPNRGRRRQCSIKGKHLAKICEIPCLATQLRSCSWNGNNSAAAAAKTINVDKWISPETATADGERERGPCKTGVLNLEVRI